MPPDQLGSPKAVKILFEPFELNVAERSLKKKGEAVPLGGRAFDLLLALIERSGETVGKNELIAKVWPDVIVGEGSLRVHMSTLRKALGDGQLGRQTYIANVKGRGYCFVAPVTRQTQDNDPSDRLTRPLALPIAPGRMADRYEAVLSLKALLQSERLTRVLSNGRSAIDPKPEKFNSAVTGMVRVFADLIASLLDVAEQIVKAEENVNAARENSQVSETSSRSATNFAIRSRNRCRREVLQRVQSGDRSQSSI